MSSVNAPFGLRPAFKEGGTPVSVQSVGSIASGYANNIFLFAPVAITADGSLILSAAAARAIGSFLGVEFTDATGRQRVSNFWPAATTGTNIVAYYTRDPYLTYEIQGSGPVAQSTIGSQYNWTTNDTNAGNTTTGISNVALDLATNGANKGLRVVGLTPGPDNAWGDLFTVVQVQISQHQNVADIAQY